MIGAGFIQATKTDDAAAKGAALALKQLKLDKVSDEKTKAAKKKAVGPDAFTTKAKPKAPPRLACKGFLCRAVERAAAAGKTKPSTWDISQTPLSIEGINWSSDGSLTISAQRTNSADSTHQKLTIKASNGWILYKRKTDTTWKKFQASTQKNSLTTEQKAVLKQYERGLKHLRKMRWMIKVGFSGRKLPSGFSIDKDNGTISFDRTQISQLMKHRLISTITAKKASKILTFSVNHHTVVDGLSVSIPATFTFRAPDVRPTARVKDRNLYASGVSHLAKYRRKPSRTQIHRVGVAGKKIRKR